MSKAMRTIAYYCRRDTEDNKDKRIRDLERDSDSSFRRTIKLRKELGEFKAGLREAERNDAELREQLTQSNTERESDRDLLREARAELADSQSCVWQLEELQRSQPRRGQSIDEVTTLLGERGGSLRLHAGGAGGEGGEIYWELAELYNIATASHNLCAGSFDDGRYLSTVLGGMLAGLAKLTFPEVNIRELLWERCRSFYAKELKAWAAGRHEAFVANLQNVGELAVGAYK
jgi:hypothetical protein